jgi:hypothetical protein
VLLEVLRRHGDLVEADLQQQYGVDLSDLWRGTLTLRRLWVLLRGLPSDSRTMLAVVGIDLPGWTLGDLLLARLIDETALMRWQWEAAHIDPKKTRHRSQPSSVLPAFGLDESIGNTGPSIARRSESNVVPLVSPHRLGSFVYGDNEAR